MRWGKILSWPTKSLSKSRKYTSIFFSRFLKSKPDPFRTSQRRIQENEQSLIDWIQKNNQFNINLVKKPSELPTYSITIEIKLLVGIGRYGKVKTEKNFKFEIKTITNSKIKPNSVLKTAAGYPIPFHPSIKIKSSIFWRKRYGIWVDHQPSDPSELLGSRLNRIFSSLVYSESSLNELLEKKVVNLKALKWYKNLFMEHKSCLFPTDIFPTTFEKSPKQIMISTNGIKSDLKTNNSAKKFKIDKRLEGYQPKKRKLSDLGDILIHSISDLRSNKRCSSNQIYLVERAWNQICDHIQWSNQDSIDNRNEQGGILLGHVYKDPDQELLFAVVESAIPGVSARGSSAYLEMDHQTWKDMVNMADQVAEEKQISSQIIGWYHTHPNELDVFMSGTDKNTQKILFCEPWHYALVLNPHREIWRAFNGPTATECYGYLINLPTSSH